jgi:hypothetical protein
VERFATTKSVCSKRLKLTGLGGKEKAGGACPVAELDRGI